MNPGRQAFAALAVHLAGWLLAWPACAAPARPNADEAAARIVADANRLRATAGAGRLVTEARLAGAAAGFARYMADTERYGHEADGREPRDRADAQGYEWCVLLDNIAYAQSPVGFTTTELASRLIEGWKSSPGHRRNLLAQTRLCPMAPA